MNYLLNRFVFNTDSFKNETNACLYELECIQISTVFILNSIWYL